MNRISRRSLLAGLAGAPAAAPLLRPRPAAGAPAATPARLNVIEIVADTWSTHWMGCYGAEQIYTPNVNALAAKSYVFDDVYAEALPTIPARRSIYTGRRIFPGYKVSQVFDLDYRCWHPLYVEDVTMSEAIIGTGMYESCLISDNQHTFLPDKNFHRGFYGWRPIRGQEGDMWETGPRRNIKLVNYLHPSQYAEYTPAGMARFLMMQYLTNKSYWQTDDDRPTAQVFTDACRWLDNNTKEGTPFYLHVETFSPHEFWDPPDDFYNAYMKSAYTGPRLIFPHYVTSVLSPVEFEPARSLYSGAVTFVDYHLGRLLAKLDELQLWDSTIVVFVADHGTMMGEQGQIHKDEGRMRTQVTKVPLMIYDPRSAGAGKRIKGFAQHTDVMPTVLDMMGIGIPSRVTGMSLAPYMQSGETIPRDMVVTGWENHGSMRTQEWLYQGRWNPGDAYEELYDLRKDPLELNNLNQQYPAMIDDYRLKLKAYMDSGWPITKGTFLQPEEDPNVPA